MFTGGGCIILDLATVGVALETFDGPMVVSIRSFGHEAFRDWAKREGESEGSGGEKAKRTRGRAQSNAAKERGMEREKGRGNRLKEARQPLR